MLISTVLQDFFVRLHFMSAFIFRMHPFPTFLDSYGRQGPHMVKSAYEPRGPSGRSLSRFPWHEATRNISTPPWMGWPVRRYPFIHLGGERHRESKVSCLRTQRNVPGQGSNPERSLRSRAH